MSNFVAVKTEIDDMKNSRTKVLNNIGMKVGEAVISRAKEDKLSERMIVDIDNLIEGLSKEEQVIILERAILSVARNGEFAKGMSKTENKGKKSTTNPFGKKYEI